MSVVSTLPTEIWHEILHEVIDVPYVFDTTVPPEGCFWHHQNVYHRREPYFESETQRRLLRLVCKSWKLFADEHQYRWITYDTGFLANPAERREAEKALGSGNLEISQANKGKLQRLLLAVRGNDGLLAFRKAIDHFSAKLTTLFVDCSDKYAVPIFDHLIKQRAMLPCLRCLMLKALDFRSTPLRSISSCFPKLTGLTLERGVFPHNPEDSLCLPQLESLYFDFKELGGMVPEHWSMPGLVRLSLPLTNDQEEKDVVLRFMKAHGAKLVFLHLNASIETDLPKELWDWCPSLTEIATSFSKVLLGGPIPTKHPLTYLVHFVSSRFRVDWRDDRCSDDTPEGTVAIVIRNIRLLPPGFNTFMVAITSWSDDSIARPAHSAIELFWERVYKECRSRNIRLEDGSRKTFDEYFLIES